MGKTKDLSPEQNRLVEEYRRSRNKTEAYKAVYTDWEIRLKEGTVSKRAYDAFAPLMAEIKRLDKIDEDAQKKAAQKEAEDLRKLWSRKDSVIRLIDILDDCQRTRNYAAEKFQEIPVAAARLERDTVDSLNKMMGYNEPEQQVVDTTITVEFGDGLEEFAV
jgi:Mg2+ and Co2+ transporter CorA